MIIGVHEKASGRIVSIYNVPTADAVVLEAGQQYKTSPSALSFDDHYYDTSSNQFADKTAASFAFDKAQITANGADTATINNVPQNTFVTWPDGQITEVNDGSIEFAVDMPGTHKLIIDSVSHKIQEITIEAVA